MSGHALERPRIAKTGDEYPWRVDCPCGNWQQGRTWRQVLVWTLDHLKAGHGPIC